MEKIKFNYLLEHIEQLDEMAKPATAYGPLNDKYMEVSPKLATLDQKTLGSGAGGAAKSNLFKKTIIGLYNDTVKEFKYTLPVINAKINKIVDNLFKDVDKDFTEFDIDTFEDIFPNSDSDPHYDSAIKLAEAIVYGKYHPDFKSKTPAEFAELQLPTRVKKQLMNIMDNISGSNTAGSLLDNLLQQRVDMIENPDDENAALFGPLDVVKYITGSRSADKKAMDEAFNKLFIIPRGQIEKDPAVLNRQKIINSPEFREKLTLDLFDHYRLSDRSRSSSAMQSDNLFQTATNMSKADYSVLRTEVSDIIKELKTLNRKQRTAIKKSKNPQVISPTLKNYKETGDVPKEEESNDSDDLNEYLSTILSIWGVDVKKNINTEFDPSKAAFINSVIEPGVFIPRKAANGITETSYNLISQFLTKYYNTYEDGGIIFTSDDFKTKVIDKIASLKTAPNEVEVLESIYNGLEDSNFNTLGSDENESQIGGIENTVSRAVFNRPENQGKLQQVKDVIKLELQSIEAQLNYNMMRLMAAADKQMMAAGNQAAVNSQAMQQPQEPVQEACDATFGYMIDQMQKDSKFKGDTSQFNDRGFKKPANYWHWLNK